MEDVASSSLPAKAGRGIRRPLWLVAGAGFLAVSCVAWAVLREPADSDACVAPTVETLRTLASKSDHVVVGDVRRRVELEEGGTSSSGFLVSVTQSYAGLEASREVAVWQPLDVSDLSTGQVLLFLRGHKDTQSGGVDVDGHDVVDSGAVFAISDEAIHRVCREDTSNGLEMSALDRVFG